MFGGAYKEDIRVALTGKSLGDPWQCEDLRRDLPIFAFRRASEFIGESARQALREDLQANMWKRQTIVG